MNARDYALYLIHQAHLPGWNKPTKLKPASLDPRDRALGESIAAVVAKNLLLLKYAIKHYSGREMKAVDPVVQMILAVAIAQLRYFDRVPDSAAVDEAVEQTKRLKLGRAGGFVNAVLRRATREPELPLPSRERVEDYVRIVLSHPPELFHRMVSLMGEKKALALCERNNTEPPTIVRAGDTFLSQLREGIAARRHKQDGMWVVEGASEGDFAKWSDAGIAQVQDPTSASVVSKLELDTGERGLDRCCGMGTKTLQMASAAGASGFVAALDPSKFRIERLNALLAKREITWVQTHAVGMLDQITIDRPFDRILVDAPCSNSGVIIRRPEARYRQDAKSTASVVQLQQRILLDTIPHLRPGGTLVYSTCSIWPEENGDQVTWLTKQTDDFEVVSVETTLPSLNAEAIHHCDGGFTAVLTKRK